MPPKRWPPKVPLGPMEDVLPLIEADDETLDSLMLPSKQLLGEEAPKAFGPDELDAAGLLSCHCKRETSDHFRHVQSLSAKLFGNWKAREVEVGRSRAGKLRREEYICACLRQNSTVTYLNCSMNPIGDVGAKQLASLLAGPKPPLQRLALNGCGIGSEGALALAQALPESTLEALELMQNGICDEGGQGLLAAMKESRLKELLLSMNPIKEGTAEQLERAMMLR